MSSYERRVDALEHAPEAPRMTDAELNAALREAYNVADLGEYSALLKTLSGEERRWRNHGKVLRGEPPSRDTNDLMRERRGELGEDGWRDWVASWQFIENASIEQGRERAKEQRRLEDIAIERGWWPTRRRWFMYRHSPESYPSGVAHLRGEKPCCAAGQCVSVGESL